MNRTLSSVGLLGLLTSTVLAADLPRTRRTIEVVPPAFTWTGAYGGLFAGYGVLDSATHFLCTGPDGVSAGVNCPVIPSRQASRDGFIAGGEVGYTWQAGHGLIVGAAADYQATRLWDYAAPEGTFARSGGGASLFDVAHAGQRLDQLATFRGKVGLGIDRTVLYATGGLALGNVRVDTNLPLWFGSPLFDGRKGEVRAGYVAGAGIEYAFSQHLSAKVEGLYYDLGGRAVLSEPFYRILPGYHAGARVATDGFLTRVGLNYRFGAGLPDLPPAGAAGPAAWAFEGGLRYVYSSGGPRYTLGSALTPGQVNSRLIYDGAEAHAGESFARVEHTPTGLFAKAFLGTGGVTTGRLSDEDFPPALRRYSKTLSPIKDGDISYGVIDFGYDVLRRDGFKLGGFLGYQYEAELLNGYGCRQVGGSRSGICAGDDSVPDTVKILSENQRWNALRVGLIGEARFDRLRLSLEGAYLPVVALEGVDRHWLRPDINALPQRGRGDGYFAEGIVSYDLTPRVSVGVGGRYWRMQTESGHTQFPALPRSPTKFETDRYGAFAQISYRLSDFGLGGADAQPVLIRKD